MKNKVIIAAIALIAVFLVGFIPPYVKANRLENELRQTRQDGAGAELRDLIALAYAQANQKNYGLASETSGRFFNRVREVASQTQDVSRRKALDDLLTSRDKITAQLVAIGLCIRLVGGSRVFAGCLRDRWTRPC